jgi:hypothetical protein
LLIPNVGGANSISDKVDQPLLPLRTAGAQLKVKEGWSLDEFTDCFPSLGFQPTFNPSVKIFQAPENCYRLLMTTNHAS